MKINICVSCELFFKICMTKKDEDSSWRKFSRALKPAVEEIRKYPLIIQALPILADSRVKHRNG